MVYTLIESKRRDWLDMGQDVYLDLRYVEAEMTDSVVNGKGFVVTEEYTCPCGESSVHYLSKNFPNLKEGYPFDVCKSCDRLFDLKHRGYAKPLPQAL